MCPEPILHPLGHLTAILHPKSHPCAVSWPHPAPAGISTRSEFPWQSKGWSVVNTYLLQSPWGMERWRVG